MCTIGDFIEGREIEILMENSTLESQASWKGVARKRVVGSIPAFSATVVFV